jgi:hypothetical protein
MNSTCRVSAQRGEYLTIKLHDLNLRNYYSLKNEMAKNEKKEL